MKPAEGPIDHDAVDPAWRWMFEDRYFVVPMVENVGVPTSLWPFEPRLASRTGISPRAAWGAKASGSGGLFDGAVSPSVPSSFRWRPVDGSADGIWQYMKLGRETGGEGRHTWVVVFEMPPAFSGTEKTLMGAGDAVSLQVSGSVIRHVNYADSDAMSVSVGGFVGLAMVVSTYDKNVSFPGPTGHLYLNGVEVQTGFGATPESYLNAQWAVGAKVAVGKGSLNGFPGVIYWAGWFSRPWTADEVALAAADPFGWMYDEHGVFSPPCAKQIEDCGPVQRNLLEVAGPARRNLVEPCGQVGRELLETAGAAQRNLTEAAPAARRNLTEDAGPVGEVEDCN